MDAMPKQCKLPRYDYGSPGVLGYYQATLQDIVQYPDARTELFHNFREFGNAVLFCLLMEQALSQVCLHLIFKVRIRSIKNLKCIVH